MWPSVAERGIGCGVGRECDFDLVSSEPGWLEVGVGVEVMEREMKRGKYSERKRQREEEGCVGPNPLPRSIGLGVASPTEGWKMRRGGE